jgi:hypothetical protein
LPYTDQNGLHKAQEPQHDTAYTTLVLPPTGHQWQIMGLVLGLLSAGTDNAAGCLGKQIYINVLRSRTGHYDKLEIAALPQFFIRVTKSVIHCFFG